MNSDAYFNGSMIGGYSTFADDVNSYTIGTNVLDEYDETSFLFTTKDLTHPDDFFIQEMPPTSSPSTGQDMTSGEYKVHSPTHSDSQDSCGTQTLYNTPNQATPYSGFTNSTQGSHNVQSTIPTDTSVPYQYPTPAKSAASVNFAGTRANHQQVLNAMQRLLTWASYLQSETDHAAMCQMFHDSIRLEGQMLNAVMAKPLLPEATAEVPIEVPALVDDDSNSGSPQPFTSVEDFDVLDLGYKAEF
jgi:hypothetical protein